jgi:hypothetical protein
MLFVVVIVSIILFISLTLKAMLNLDT